MSTSIKHDRRLEEAAELLALARRWRGQTNLSLEDIAEAESIRPGVLMDRYPAGGYRGDNVNVAVESATSLHHLLIAGAIAALMAAIFKLIHSAFFGGGGSGGGGGGGGGGNDFNRHEFERRLDDAIARSHESTASQNEARNLSHNVPKEDTLEILESIKASARGCGVSGDIIDKHMGNASDAIRYFLEDHQHGFRWDVFEHATRPANMLLCTHHNALLIQKNLIATIMNIHDALPERLREIKHVLDTGISLRTLQVNPNYPIFVTTWNINAAVAPITNRQDMKDYKHMADFIRETMRDVRDYTGPNSNIFAQFLGLIKHLKQPDTPKNFRTVMLSLEILKDRVHHMGELGEVLQQYGADLHKLEQLVGEVEDEIKKIENTDLTHPQPGGHLDIDDVQNNAFVYQKCLSSAIAYMRDIVAMVQSTRAVVMAASKTVDDVITAHEHLTKFYDGLADRLNKAYP